MGQAAEHERIVDILGGPAVLKVNVQSMADLGRQIEHGLPVDSLLRLARDFGLAQESLLRPLGLSKATLARIKKSRGRLSEHVSDRLFRVAAVLAQAEEVLGSPENAIAWLNEGIPALGGATPLSRLTTTEGYQAVLDILGRIEYGVYS